MSLKLLLLSAALALPATLTAAQAQDTAPVAPMAVPALPPTPAEPASPTTPAAPAAPERLRLTARPGTYGEYATSLQIRFQLSDMHFEAQPGKTVKAADLAALNARAGAQIGDMNATLNKSWLLQTGKSFVRVQPPVNGNSVVLTTTLLNMPDVAHPGKTRSVSVGTTLTTDPSGRIVGVAVTSSDPQLQKLYGAMNLQTLIQNAQQAGNGSLYGQPLVVGQPLTRDTTTDVQRLMQSILGAVVPTTQVQARPLMMHVTTTYTGNDAQGNLLFSRTVGAEPWNVSLTINGLALQMAVTAVGGGGTLVVRPDGLSQSETASQTLAMQMLSDMPGEPYRMVMRLQYTLSTATTLKKITLP